MGYFLGGTYGKTNGKADGIFLGYFYWDIIYSTGKPMGFYEFGT
jgi:hypothetical protein